MRLFMTVCAVLLFVSSARAQSAEAPIFSVGDTWKRNVNNGDMREVRVVKVEDGGTWFSGGRADCPTCLSFLDKGFTLTKITDADGKDVDLTRMRFVQLGPE